MPWLRSTVAMLLSMSLATAADWPEWLGPNRDGVSPEAISPWKRAPKVLWRRAVGDGQSSPVVAKGRVFLHAQVPGKEEEEVLCFAADTGEPLWHTAYARTAFKSLWAGAGPRATPAVVDGRIYAFGVTGVLSCFKADSGEKVWQVDTLKNFGAKNLFFGVSCSPLLEGDKVLVNVGGKGASIVAFDKDNGAVVWKSLDDGASYSSPISFGQDKARQAVFLTQEGLVSLHPPDGSLFWRFPLRDRLLESSITPVRAGDLLVASSITYGSVALRLKSKENKPSIDEVWKNNQLTCYFSTPVPVGGEIYMVTGRLSLNPLASKSESEATLRCVDVKTGKERWHKSKVGAYHAALLRTANDKLLMLEDAGNLVLLDPDPKEYRELARAKACGQTWAHPALANGRLYLRDEKELICLRLGD